ncbi:MAG: nitrile hydratase subunit beta, partial [Gammaproteobacteria bacterium]
RERTDPVEYLASSYYENWLRGLQTLLVEKGVLTEAEIEQRIREIAGNEDKA